MTGLRASLDTERGAGRDEIEQGASLLTEEHPAREHLPEAGVPESSTASRSQLALPQSAGPSHSRPFGLLATRPEPTTSSDTVRLAGSEPQAATVTASPNTRPQGLDSNMRHSTRDWGGYLYQRTTSEIGLR